LAFSLFGPFVWNSELEQKRKNIIIEMKVSLKNLF
jgi:hypothetical protein